MKILISWLADTHDFNRKDDKGGVSTTGPTYAFHQHFYEDYEKHIILSAKSITDIKLERLVNKLKLDFRSHEIVPDSIPVDDVIDVSEIKTKVESYILSLKATDIDIFVSPGTPQMQIAWYIIHLSLNLKTRLLQTRAAIYSKTGIPELIIINVEKSTFPFTAILNQHNEEDGSKRENYKITESIRPVYDNAFKVAQTDNVTTLILGETGTGKEHLANFIHQESSRRNGPFITVNCSSIGDSLLESRLFGYKKGAFTGAYEDSSGLFKKANRGTIFLDEIGDISPQMQQSLLRVLQEKEITPIGGIPEKIDVRIITATHKDIPSLCKDEKFRWDLYYRIAVVELELPSLQKRGISELKEMIDYFVRREKRELRKSKMLEFSKKAKDKLLQYEFPGNLRELENIIRRFYVFVENKVEEKDLPSRILQQHRPKSLNWKDVERDHIIKVLELKKNNINQSYQVLGYGSINTLKRKIEEYGIIVHIGQDNI
ncbi:sigma 54-interacting transcriptional regulator [Maribellus sediminis]|uniref:sigma 54-interacting transcriptional regulator n=1 Tax=Maribellus sediminis TaxID=2696285 RepID=UPI001431546D|nr:sigma-54 dependent transcriptional regulator [Maribellus sediminis]